MFEAPLEKGYNFAKGKIIKGIKKDKKIFLKQLNKIHGPLEYKMTEMLCRMEQDTVALEELLHISDSLPSLPNITNCKSVL